MLGRSDTPTIRFEILDINVSHVLGRDCKEGETRNIYDLVSRCISGCKEGGKRMSTILVRDHKEKETMHIYNLVSRCLRGSKEGENNSVTHSSLSNSEVEVK